MNKTCLLNKLKYLNIEMSSNLLGCCDTGASDICMYTVHCTVYIVHSIYYTVTSITVTV